MPTSDESNFFIAILRPWENLANLVLYLMGAGMANYLALASNWQVLWLGFMLMTSILIGGSALAGCYQQMAVGTSLKRTFSNTLPGTQQSTERRKLVNCLALVVGGFGIALILTFQLSRFSSLNPQVYIFIAIATVLNILYGIHPIKLLERGMGEFVLAVTGAFLFPVVAFLLQSGALNRLLVYTTLPLTIFYLAMELTRSLRPFSLNPSRYRQNTLVGRIGPERGLSLIIYLVLAGYILAAIEGVSGLSFQVLWRMLISLPIGIFLVWQLHRVRGGAKPNWKAQEISAIALVIFPAYFISILFWTS
jgi:1,4-dihydroxy-2-naphthoate octaprenyltransferase